MTTGIAAPEVEFSEILRPNRHELPWVGFPTCGFTLGPNAKGTPKTIERFYWSRAKLRAQGVYTRVRFQGTKEMCWRLCGITFPPNHGRFNSRKYYTIYIYCCCGLKARVSSKYCDSLYFMCEFKINIAYKIINY